jgi:hypothetical protein
MSLGIRPGSGPILQEHAGTGSRMRLRHHPAWAERMRTEISDAGLNSITLCEASLKNYGLFDWYDVRAEQIPSNLSLVISDGSPGDTHGGRYGRTQIATRSRLHGDSGRL